MRVLGLALASLAAALPAAAAPVKLGLVSSATGPDAEACRGLSNGVALAVQDLRREGVEAEIVRADDAGRPEAGLSALERLALRDGVTGVVGACGPAVTSAVAKAAERYGVPLVSAVAAQDELTRLGFRWVYRISTPVGERVAAVLDVAIAKSKPRTLAILAADAEDARSGARAAKAHAKEKGLRVVFDEAYAAGSADDSARLARVKAVRPDLVLVVGEGSDAALVARRAREVGLAPQAFLSGAGLVDARAGAAPDGLLGPSPWTADAGGPAAREFAGRYRSAFGSAATADAAAAYAAAVVLAREAARSGGDREVLRRRLEEGAWETALGPVRFTEYEGYTHQNRVRVRVEQVQAGKLVTVWPPEVAAAQPVWSPPASR